jgi:glycosyltransferase involved in cell wall biosynthesis
MTAPAPFPRNGVTIGIPLYNEARFIEAALRSAAPQCEVVLVSDNASSDASSRICADVAGEFPNVLVGRLPKNMGSVFNFRHVLEQATTPFFMWLGGHDLLPPDYVRTLVAALEINPSAVMAYGSTRYIGLDGEPTGTYEYGFHRLLSDRSAAVRTLALIRHLDDCSLLHGVFRTNALRDAWDGCEEAGYMAFDHVLLGHAALKGRFIAVPRTHLIRRNAHPDDTATAQFKRITGDAKRDRAPTVEELSRATMQRAQYALAENASQHRGVDDWLYRLRARWHLVNRFGPFGTTPVTSRLDRLLQLRSVRFSMTQLDRLLDTHDSHRSTPFR